MGLTAHCRAADRIPIKMIVLAGYESGKDIGDEPCEFQLWVERDHLFDEIKVPGSPHVLRRNAAGLYGSVGKTSMDPQMTPVQDSELVMALCLDPRFDLRKTYWLITGIGGIDPLTGSIGSAVWSENVIDGDALLEIDERERPQNWPYGLYAIGASAPNELPPRHSANAGWGGASLDYTMAYPLNHALAHWAYNISKGVDLPDSPGLKAWREQYKGYPLAQLPPRVMMGDVMGSARYWHGPLRTQWARDWDKLWTGGKGTFSITAMEPADYVGTLTRMSAQGFVDINRVMQLRCASNYCMPPPDLGTEKTIGVENHGTLAAIEAEYRAGSAVVDEILKNWQRYEDHIPGARN
jgi:purine nucleoside permease